MIQIFREMLSYEFLVRALIVGLLMTLCAALLGVSLVLKRYAMIGDGLSHVGFGTLAVATAMNLAPMTVSIPVVVLAAFLLLRLSENSKIKGDAAIALISTSSLAIGVVVISLTTGMNTDVCNYMFGSILGTRRDDLPLSFLLAIVVITLFVLFYHKIFAVTFDENFAKATGVNTGFYNLLLAFLTAITIVIGMRVMGALLISSLVIFPALTSMRLCKKFKSVTLCSVLVSVLCYVFGVVLSYVYKLPTGASVVLLNIAAFLLFWLANALLHGTFRKQRVVAGALGLCLLCSLWGCGRAARARDTTTTPPEARVLEIKEAMFVEQYNDIWLNPRDYLGRTIRYEGMFTEYTWEEMGLTYYSVYRNSAGCCGADGQAGFDVYWVEGASEAFPSENDWCEVVGVLEAYEEEGEQFLRIALDSLTVLDTRGLEFVK